MKLFFEICIGLTTGLIAGFVCAGLKQIFRKNYTEEEKAHARRMINRFSAVLKYFTFLLLIIGLVWCVFPGSGRNDPGADRLRQQYGRINRICSYCYFYHFCVC